MLFLLAGNPNAGKTALFNRLTGANAHVGNFPGVTVECREGRIGERPGGAFLKAPPDPRENFGNGSSESVSPRMQRELDKTKISVRPRTSPNPTPSLHITTTREQTVTPTPFSKSSCGGLGELLRGSSPGALPASSFTSSPNTTTTRKQTVTPTPLSKSSCGGLGELLPRSFPGVSPGASPVPPDITVVDLPGVYSLRPFSEEERVAREEILRGGADCIIDVVDAVSPVRNLYLTLQLAELGVPMVIALNRMDELRAGGGDFDAERLEALLGIPVVPISALRGEGIAELLSVAQHAAETGSVPGRSRFCFSDTPFRKIPAGRGNSACPPSEARTGIAPKSEAVPQAGAVPESATAYDPEGDLAAARYAFADTLCREAFTPPRESPTRRRTLALDRVLAGGFFAYPVFFLLLAAVFAVTFVLLGPFLQEMLSSLVSCLTEVLDTRLASARMASDGTAVYAVLEVLRSFLSGALCRGIGSVLSFLPVLLLLFFFLCILEDSGYLARAAYLFDRPLRRVGLSGKSAVPLLLGFGCTVPAILSVRTLPTPEGRRRTAFLLPFISCSAKIPVYTLILTAFLPVPAHRLFALGALYLGGITAGTLLLVLGNRASGKRKPRDGEEEPFLLELPDYRFPPARQVLRLLREKTADFVGKTCSVILLSSTVVWFLSAFDPSLHLTADMADSLLAHLCRGLVPVFRPLGFDDWRIPAALLTGLFAKEAVVSTLSTLGATAGALFEPASAVAFLCFVLLYPPCAAANACAARETGRWRTVGQFCFRLALSWTVSFAVYRAALFLSGLFAGG